MGQSFYIYNSGDLKRKDNTLQFISSGGEKEIFRLNELMIFMSCQRCHLIQHF